MKRQVSALIVSMLLAVPARTWAADGGLDATFGNGGVVTTAFGSIDTEVSALAVQADGKIVAAGGSGGAFALARYQFDGALDLSFGNGGTVVTPLSTDSGDYAFASDVAIQPDGKLLAAGRVGSKDEFGAWFGVVRYDTAGRPDPTFGTDGVVTTTFRMLPGTVGFHTDDSASALALQPDGKVVAAGVSWDGGIGWESFALARYNLDGSPDVTFGSGGLVRVGGALGGWAHAVVLQPDGKLVVAGNVQQQFALVRFNPDGSLDQSFGSHGTDRFGEAFALLLQPDGRLVAAGYHLVYPQPTPDQKAVYPSGSVFVLKRYETNGALDATFGDGGTVTTSFSAPFADALAVVRQPDNKLVAAGRLYDDTLTAPRRFGLARYNTDGSLDASFGTNGTVAAPDGEAYALVGLSNGDVVAAGNVDTSGVSFRLARYTSGACGNGTLDPGEACDDGNHMDGDGCDSNCTLTGCGNGIVTAGEACDDGNQSNTDGCTNICTLNVCGDGLTDVGVEECDDGNLVSGDGCDATCKLTRCGNGVITAGEECDDGNTVSGDGCDANCLTEQCGNGRIEGNEQCDDGTTADDGHCGPNCHWPLVYDAVLRPAYPITVRLSPGRADQTARVWVFPDYSGGPEPIGHYVQINGTDGDCPAGTLGLFGPKGGGLAFT